MHSTKHSTAIIIEKGDNFHHDDRKAAPSRKIPRMLNSRSLAAKNHLSFIPQTPIAFLKIFHPIFALEMRFSLTEIQPMKSIVETGRNIYCSNEYFTSSSIDSIAHSFQTPYWTADSPQLWTSVSDAAQDRCDSLDLELFTQL